MCVLVCVRRQQEVQCVLQDQVSGDLRLEGSVTQSGQSQVSVHLEETVCEWGHTDLYWTVTDTASETADEGVRRERRHEKRRQKGRRGGQKDRRGRRGQREKEERMEGEEEPQVEIRK